MEVLELGQNQAMMKKRSFDETFEGCGGTAGRKTPAALLQWSRQPSDDEEDDQNNAGRFSRCQVDQGNVEEKGIIVGWPPISSWRKRHLHDYQGMVN